MGVFPGCRRFRIRLGRLGFAHYLHGYRKHDRDQFSLIRLADRDPSTLQAPCKPPPSWSAEFFWFTLIWILVIVKTGESFLVCDGMNDLVMPVRCWSPSPPGCAPRLNAFVSRLVLMARRETGTAYLLWCASLVGVCGLQRYYLGQTLVGTLYLLSFGFCGLGQLMDLFLIPGLVERSNMADAAHRLLTGSLATASLATADGSSGDQVLPPQSPAALTLEQKILQRCEHEPASLAHFILATGEPSGKIRAVVEEMAAQGLLRQTISDSGSVLYQLH